MLTDNLIRTNSSLLPAGRLKVDHDQVLEILFRELFLLSLPVPHPVHHFVRIVNRRLGVVVGNLTDQAEGLRPLQEPLQIQVHIANINKTISVTVELAHGES